MKINDMKSALIPEMENELRDILSYWSANAMDTEFGGFIGEINSQGQKHKHADKGVVLNARLLWTFSAAYNFSGDPEYLKLADRAFDYLNNHFWDQTNGGLFWAVNYKGEVINRRKQAYAKGFGIYGLSEYFKASGKQESLHLALQLYELIETHFKDKTFGGYIEALDEDWTPLEDMRLSLKDANEPKSMNTHLHIIEPYTNLYRVWPNQQLKERIQHLLMVFSNYIVNADTYHFNLFFDLDWTVKSSIVSYGHDIEGAWLLTEAANEIGDAEMLSQMKQIGLNMVKATVKEGMDNDGSVYYELEDGHLDMDKHWWPQAEALVGLMDAWQNTGQNIYIERMYKVWQFIKTHIKDKTHGEWHWKVDAKGTPDTEPPKVGFWKCPYHNSRALMEVINRMKLIESHHEVSKS